MVDYLHIRQGSESTEKCHGFSRSGWTTKDKRFMLSQPCVEQALMPHCINGRDDNIRGSNLMCLHFNLRYFGLPGCPLPIQSYLENS